jgi:hypothetical protein
MPGEMIAADQQVPGVGGQEIACLQSPGSGRPAIPARWRGAVQIIPAAGPG